MSAFTTAEPPEHPEHSGHLAPEHFPPAAIHEHLGITMEEATADRCVGTMPVEGNTQPFGLLHGGASCVLAESLASFAATLYALPDRVAVGVDLNATHHRAVGSGLVRGVATPLHRGSSTATYDVVISDEQDRRVCTVRLTCYLRPAPSIGSSSPPA